MSKVLDLAKLKVVPFIESLGYEVVDIEYKKEYEQMALTFFIYSPAAGGTSLNDCEKVHTAIDPLLDEIDITEGRPYTLNVSSPGLDRPFKTRRDYERNLNKEVEVKLYAPINGKKSFEGLLLSFLPNATKTGAFDVEIKTSKETVNISFDKIALVRPLVKF